MRGDETWQLRVWYAQTVHILSHLPFCMWYLSCWYYWNQMKRSLTDRQSGRDVKAERWLSRSDIDTSLRSYSWTEDAKNFLCASESLLMSSSVFVTVLLEASFTSVLIVIQRRLSCQLLANIISFLSCSHMKSSDAKASKCHM